MDILMVAAEFSPYARQTQAADTAAALAKTLRQSGHDVTVAVPRYRGFEQQGLLVARRLTPLRLPDGTEVTVFDGQLASGARLVLFDARDWFQRPGVYGEEGKDYPDNAARFGLLSQAAVALARERAQHGQGFDVAHLHDWPAAPVAVTFRERGQGSIATVLTIHDVRRQGKVAAKDLAALGIPRELNSHDGVKLGNRANVL